MANSQRTKPKEAKPPLVLKISADDSALRELFDLIKSTDFDAEVLAERGPDSFHALATEFAEAPQRFIQVNTQASPTAGASELIIRLEPTESFRRRVLAARAGKREFKIVGKIDHNHTSPKE